MNSLTARVKQIDKQEGLYITTCQLGLQELKIVTLELPSFVELDKNVKLSVKSTDMAVAKNFRGDISILNQLKAKVVAVENGKLLSSIQVDVEGFTLESLITQEASLRMKLSVGDEVLVLLKGSEVFVCG